MHYAEKLSIQKRKSRYRKEYQKPIAFIGRLVLGYYLRVTSEGARKALFICIA